MDFIHTLSTTPLKHQAMDYTFLRQEGINHLKRMAGQLWTDFNTHDPGITILEQVCYALTDLAHRINYTLPDLLSNYGTNPYDNLYRPEQILPSYPVTINDLRKLIVDMKGVKNAWIEKVEKPKIPLFFNVGDSENALSLQEGDSLTAKSIYLQGLYRIFIDGTAEDREVVLNRLYAHRGLGEDFETIQWLESEAIQVYAQIEIAALDNAESVLLEIYQRLADYISPPIRFSSLSEQRQAGKSVEEIFEGPLLEQGLIDSEVLQPAQRRTVLRTSDLIHEIMDVAGVKAIRQISISADGGTSKEPWSLDLDSSKVPQLDLSASDIRLERNQLVANIKKIDNLETAPKRVSNPLELQLPAGQDRKVENYYSIQHQFPATYGIGAMGLPDSASPLRKAQAKQLQAYLLFFDQLLANDFSQLAHVKDLFSFEATAQTYFSQAIEDSTLGIDDIRSTDLVTPENRLQQITENPDPADAKKVANFDDRRNRFLNHLLARFAEQFTDYSLVLPETVSTEAVSAKLAQDKQAFLKNYPQLSQARGTAAGLEKRLQHKLGMVDEAGNFHDKEERFYIVEHILLRPIAEDKQQQVPFLVKPRSKDPFSLQITLVFPNWPSRFRNSNFKTFIERTLREETPAHLSFLDIKWLDKSTMQTFASTYSNWSNKWGQYWREKQKRQPEGQPVTTTIQIQLRDARDRLIDWLELGETYPLRDLVVKDSQLMVVCGTPAKISIENSQLGVLYQLYKNDTEAGINLPPPINEGQGTGETLILETNNIIAETTFKILATKEQSRREAYLNQTVTVHLKPDAKVSMDSNIINYAGAVTIKVTNTQKDSTYKLYTRSIRDDEFIHPAPGEPIDGNEMIRVQVPDEKLGNEVIEKEHEVWVRKPTDSLDRYKYWQPQECADGENIEFTLNKNDNLIDDFIVVVVQTYKNLDAQLEPTVVLVRPNLTPQDFQVSKLNHSQLQISNGQPGVFYYFKLDSEGEDLGLPAYFHKQGKGLEQLKIEVDYVITGTQPEALVNPIVETSLLPKNTTQLYVYAVKAQTRVGTFLTGPVPLKFE
jgi:hypothetical protein